MSRRHTNNGVEAWRRGVFLALVAMCVAVFTAVSVFADELDAPQHPGSGCGNGPTCNQCCDKKWGWNPTALVTCNERCCGNVICAEEPDRDAGDECDLEETGDLGDSGCTATTCEKKCLTHGCNPFAFDYHYCVAECIQTPWPCRLKCHP